MWCTSSRDRQTSDRVWGVKGCAFDVGCSWGSRDCSCVQLYGLHQDVNAGEALEDLGVLRERSGESAFRSVSKYLEIRKTVPYSFQEKNYDVSELGNNLEEFPLVFTSPFRHEHILTLTCEVAVTIGARRNRRPGDLQ